MDVDFNDLVLAAGKWGVMVFVLGFALGSTVERGYHGRYLGMKIYFPASRKFKFVVFGVVLLSFVVAGFCSGVNFRASPPLPVVQPVVPAAPEILFRGEYSVRALCELLAKVEDKPYSLVESGSGKVKIYGVLRSEHSVSLRVLIEGMGYIVDVGSMIVVRPGQRKDRVLEPEVFVEFRPVFRKPSELVKLVTASGAGPVTTSFSLPDSPVGDRVRTNSVDQSEPKVGLYLPDDASGVLYVRSVERQASLELERLLVLDKPVGEFEVSFRVVEVSSQDTRIFRLGITNSLFSIGSSVSLDATIKEVLRGAWADWGEVKLQASSTRLRGCVHNRESLDFRCRSGDEVNMFSGQSVGYVSQSSDYQPAVGVAQKVTRISTASIGQNLRMRFSTKDAGSYFYEIGLNSTRQTGTVTLDGNPVPNTSDLRHLFSGIGRYEVPVVIAELSRESANLSKSDPGIGVLSWFGSRERGWSDSRILFVVEGRVAE